MSVKDLTGIPEAYGTEIPRTDSGQYLGLSREGWSVRLCMECFNPVSCHGKQYSRFSENTVIVTPKEFSATEYLEKVFADAGDEFDRVMRFGADGTPGTPRS